MEINIITNNENTGESSIERCVCCNQAQNNLTNLSVCNFAYLIERLVDIKLKSNTSKICSFCHIILKKIYKFTKQLELSLGLIMQDKPRTNCYNLEISDVVILDINLTINQYNKLTEIKEEFLKVKNEITDFDDLRTQPESEDHNSNDDLKIEPFRTLISENVTLKNKKTKTVLPISKRPRTQLEDNYKGKIKIVTITFDEVMKERLEEQQNERYQRLPYKCEGCIISFHYEHGLKKHLDKSHFPHQNGIECSICTCICPTQISYDGHRMRHLKRYECVPCGKRSATLYTILKHNNEVHDRIDVTYKCKRCDFTTINFSEHRRHLRTHGQKAVCNVCDKSFVNNSSLAVHVSSVHNTSNETFPCTKCDKVYNKRASLVSHERLHNSGYFYCNDCQRTFKSKAILSIHLKRHLKHAKDDVWRYKCNDCDKKFMVKRKLEDHINFEHMKIIKYVCNICSKIFKTNRILTRHIKSVHEKVRPPKNKICDHCGRGFSSSAVLRNHITTHTGERPHKCPYCSATFGQPAALYTHKKLVHKKRN